MSHRSRYILGQLDQENFALRDSADVFYSADQTSARGLPLATRRPVVSVVHHQPNRSVINQISVRRHAGLICLSEHVRSMLPSEMKKHSRVLPWGPDLGSPLYSNVDESLGVVSAGKSNRDLGTLVSALGRTGDAAVVYDSFSAVRDAPAWVKLIQPGHESEDPDSPGVYLATRVIRDMARASVVAIPVRDGNRLTGLTEINDALALGKPLIITRSCFLPAGIEASGCAIFVDPEDVDGWEAALLKLRDPELRREMGARGRKFAEREWNNKLWEKGLRDFIESL